MKKIISLVIAAVFALTLTASADQAGNAALDAFSQLTNQPVATPAAIVWDKAPADYLDDVMNGKYVVPMMDAAVAGELAPDLQALSAITTSDIAAFAVEKGLPEYQVRNSYFMALATVLRAEIMVNPASEDRYRNIQIILSLFLEDSDDRLAETSRDAIRSSMTREYAEVIASNYSLPTSFVEFVIMDDDWNDDMWDNDDDWAVNTGYDWSYDDTPYDDTPYDNTPYIPVVTDVPAVTSAPVRYDDTPYDNTPDYTNTPDYNTPDYNTPDYNTPDYNTPDYTNTPDYNTPDYNTPDYTNTPDYNTPDYNTPDYNTPDYNTPDYNTPDYNTPDYNTPDYDNTPDD